MNLSSFLYESKKYIGVLQGDQMINLTLLNDLYKKQHLVDSTIPANLEQFIENHETLIPYAEKLLEYFDENRLEIQGVTCSLSEVDILAPLTKPEKIICVGLNYLDHCKETGMEPPAAPVIFSKYANAIIGHKEDIECPVNSNQVDFEAELVVVIGKEAKRISEEDAEGHVFGYTIMNDVSARDIQFADGQWVRGKSPDTFAPIGPVIVTKDQIEDPHQLDISLTLNGEIMQQSNTKNLIHRIPAIISYLSQSMTLKPGDIIATGTPPGVGMGRDPKVWLNEGDELSITIEHIGTLTNFVKKTAASEKNSSKESLLSN